MTDENPNEHTVERTPEEQTSPPQYGVGPFSIREVALAGIWLVAFIVSFFPLGLVDGPLRALFGGVSVWGSGVSWVLAIALPTVAVFLLGLRRLSPQGIRRFGSLGIDQFASVAFSVAALVWISWLWETVSVAIEFGVWARSWVVWVEAILMLAGVVLTVFAPLLPVLSRDFADREEIPAHRNARPVRAVSPRPKPVRPAPAETTPHDQAAYAAAPSDTGAHAGLPLYSAGQQYDTGAQQHYDTGAQQHYDTGAQPQYDTGAQQHYDTTAYPVQADAPRETGAGSSDAASHTPAAVIWDPETDASAEHGATDDTVTSATDVFAPLTEDDHSGAQPSVDDTVTSAQPASQAFWALVPEERDILDEYGRPLFRIGPTAWALVIEDRGAAYVVRHEDGRVGFLHDVSGVTRG